MKFADLHVHSNLSDGTDSPEEIIYKSAKAELSAIAIADHDTVEGIAEAIEAARQNGIEVLPAIELSAEYNGSEVHILGYLINWQDKALREKLETLRKDRVGRIYKIIDKLKTINIGLNPEAVFEIGGKSTIGRLHVARAMVREGIVGSISEAFKKYIGDKCPAYVLGFRFSPAEAIKLIKSVGGIAVLAHPYTLNNDELIPKFVESGLMGLEVYYPEHSQGQTNFYLKLAKKYNLLLTGGSDYHGSAKPDIGLGSVKVSYELVEELRAVKEK